MPFVRIKYFPEEATSMDVRRFFKKIEIPDGGVHVIGGPKGLVYVNLHNEEGTSKYKKLELTFN
jgi:hypothetical protein